MKTLKTTVAVSFLALTLVATAVTSAFANEFETKQEARTFNRGIQQQVRAVKSDRLPIQQNVKALRNDLRALKQDFRAGNLERSEFRAQRLVLQQSLRSARQQLQPFNAQIRGLRSQLVNLRNFVPAVPQVAQTTPVNRLVINNLGDIRSAGQQVGQTINALNNTKVAGPRLAGANFQRGVRSNTIRPNNTPIVLPKGQGTLLSLVADESMAREVTVDVDDNLTVAFEATPQLLNSMNTLRELSN